jgi:type IV pilus assembly protein PilB
MKMKLGELLVKANLVSPRQVQDGLGYQRRHGGRLGQALVALGHVKEEAIIGLLSRRYGVPEIKLDDFPLDPAVVGILPGALAWKHRMLPLSRSGATLQIAMADPTNTQATEEVKLLTGYYVEKVKAGVITLKEVVHHTEP